MLWFNFILGSNFVFFCFWGIVMYEFETKENKFEPRIKLNYNIYMPIQHQYPGRLP